MNHKTPSSDRSPICLSQEERADISRVANQCEELAKHKTGEDAVKYCEIAAANFEMARNYSKAHEMRILAQKFKPEKPIIPQKNSFAASIISVGLLGGLFFLYSGISGKVIAGIENNTSDVIGLVLVLIAIGLGVFYILRKKRRK